MGFCVNCPGNVCEKKRRYILRFSLKNGRLILVYVDYETGKSMMRSYASGMDCRRTFFNVDDKQYTVQLSAVEHMSLEEV